jgi:hypothetical protein
MISIFIFLTAYSAGWIQDHVSRPTIFLYSQRISSKTPGKNFNLLRDSGFPNGIPNNPVTFWTLTLLARAKSFRVM